MLGRRDGTSWLRVIRDVLGLLLLSDIAYLLLVAVNHNTRWPVGSVMVGDLWQGDAYVHRMHPELDPQRIVVGLNLVKDNHRISYSSAQTILSLISHRLLFALVTIPMLILAQRAIKAAIEHDPFTRQMVRRLRVLGWVVLVGGGLSELAEYVCARILLNITLPKDTLDFAQPDVDITLWWLFPALIVLAFAEIVRRGVAMRDELDTVV